MGDRGNVKVIFDAPAAGQAVYLYTHWHGSELPDIVRYALRRGKERWNDPAYLTRIIFSEMLLNDGDNTLHNLIGFGIAPYECDTGVLVTVNTTDQTVQVNRGVQSFDQYISPKRDESEA